jgi:L-ascorbate metabolism protein UlaG (beta-lactamase superfamily)
MITPAKQGAALAREIAETIPARGLALWWLGQSGFVIKSNSATLVVDLYLSDSLTLKYANSGRPHVRMTALALEPDQLRGVDLVLCSHRHTDHMDAATLLPLLAANPSARVGLPAALADHAAALGVDPARQVPLVGGQQFEVAGFHVRAIPSAHETLETDRLGQHLFLGFVIESNGARVYHGGDGVVYPGLIEALGPAPFDALLLPINGRDQARGVPGNMSAAEAVDLARSIRPRFIVPHHYDMFTFNTVPVSAFEAEAARLPAGVSARVLRCGERWEIAT